MTKSSRPTVYIVHDLGKLNFSPASEYGRLVSCVKGHVAPADVQEALKVLQRSLAQITVHDFIVAAGHPALIAMAGAIQADYTGSLRILCWDGQTQKYVLVEEQVYEDDSGGGD